MKNKTKPTLILLKRATIHLDNGDPCEAVETLNRALAGQMDDETRRQVNKAMDEAHLGNPATAQTMLALLIADLEPKNPAAVALGRLGGLKGGKAKSDAKTKAAQANAKKGGWRNRPPRKDGCTCPADNSGATRPCPVHPGVFL